MKIFFIGVVISLLSLTGCETTSTGVRALDSTYVQPSRNEFRGAWVYDPRRFDPDEVVHHLKKAGFNAVFVRLSSAGSAYYPSNVLPKAPGTDQDYAQAYADAGKKYGVKVHAWHVCFMMHYASSKAINLAIKKGEVMRDAKGKALRPTYNVPIRTPALKSNRDLESRAMVELVTKYPLDGVQFDYIRYFSPKVDYSSASRAGFEKMIGSKVKKWPSDVVSGRLKDRYHQWKSDLISSLVKEVSQDIRAANPRAQISAAVWHTPEVGEKDYGQDWVQWVRSGYLDFVVPMDYTKNDDIFAEWIKNQQEIVGGKIPLYAGIGSYMHRTSEQLNRQIHLCRKTGLSGYVLYSYDELFNSNYLMKVSN